MGEDIKKYHAALLLNALLFPGMGHFYLKQRLKGGIVMAVTSVFLFIALAGFVYAYYQSLQSIPISDTIVIQLATGFREAWIVWRAPIIYSFIGILILWLYGILDVLIQRKKGVKDERM